MMSVQFALGVPLTIHASSSVVVSTSSCEEETLGANPNYLDQAGVAQR
jgi:hypothetical protein